MRKSRVLVLAMLVALIVAFSIAPLTASAGPPPPPRSHYTSYDQGCYSGCGHYQGGWYKVHWGDTLTKIARYHGTSVWHLASINHLKNPNCIYAGQWLRVP